jgi:ketosteroid isomerase-like protein
MSPPADDLELARFAFDAYNRRDREALESLFTATTVWRPSMTGGDTVQGKRFVGLEGLHTFLAEVQETWRDLLADDGVFESLGEGRVLVAYQLRGVGRASGIELSRPVWSALRLAGGRIESMLVFNSRDEALAELEAA